MKRTITETIERQCCDPKKDMIGTAYHLVMMCRHCGHLWLFETPFGDDPTAIHTLTFHRPGVAEAQL